MYLPTVFEQPIPLEPVTRDDFIDEPTDDDRSDTSSTLAADPGLPHQRKPWRRATG